MLNHSVMFSGGVRTMNTGFRNRFIFVPAAGATLRIDLRIETSGRQIKTPQPKKNSRTYVTQCFFW